MRSPSATSPAGSARGVLGDRRALAGERRLLRLERRRADDAPVGGDDVARLDLHDVAGHDVDRGHEGDACRRARTLACGTCRFDSASTLARAFSSCRDPSTTLSRISSATMIAGRDLADRRGSPTVTATSMMFIGSRSCASATAHTDGGFSAVISFGP